MNMKTLAALAAMTVVLGACWKKEEKENKPAADPTPAGMSANPSGDAAKTDMPKAEPSKEEPKKDDHGSSAGSSEQPAKS